ncbi:C42S1 protein, partial [Atractosteus spatula]|nr:C42S1 protein [Atractosteus spatula]
MGCCFRLALQVKTQHASRRSTPGAAPRGDASLLECHEVPVFGLARAWVSLLRLHLWRCSSANPSLRCFRARAALSGSPPPGTIRQRNLRFCPDRSDQESERPQRDAGGEGGGGGSRNVFPSLPVRLNPELVGGGGGWVRRRFGGGGGGGGEDDWTGLDRIAGNGLSPLLAGPDASAGCPPLSSPFYFFRRGFAVSQEEGKGVERDLVVFYNRDKSSSHERVLAQDRMLRGGEASAARRWGSCSLDRTSDLVSAPRLEARVSGPLPPAPLSGTAESTGLFLPPVFKPGCLEIFSFISAQLTMSSRAAEEKKKRRRIDRSMIGEPMNFVHLTHIGSGEMPEGLPPHSRGSEEGEEEVPSADPYQPPRSKSTSPLGAGGGVWALSKPRLLPRSVGLVVLVGETDPAMAHPSSVSSRESRRWKAQTSLGRRREGRLQFARCLLVRPQHESRKVAASDWNALCTPMVLSRQDCLPGTPRQQSRPEKARGYGNSERLEGGGESKGPRRCRGGHRLVDPDGVNEVTRVTCDTFAQVKAGRAPGVIDEEDEAEINTCVSDQTCLPRQQGNVSCSSPASASERPGALNPGVNDWVLLPWGTSVSTWRSVIPHPRPLGKPPSAVPARPPGSLHESESVTLSPSLSALYLRSPGARAALIG